MGGSEMSDESEDEEEILEPDEFGRLFIHI